MTHEALDFKPSQPYSMGVELELQILNCRDYNLARDAADLIGLIDKSEHAGEVKPEITESMIELNSSIHHDYGTLVQELRSMRDAVARAAGRLNLRVAGGGSHPFHKWSERRIYPTARFKHLLTLYGYLAKQFTIFGQHVHIGVPDGDAALYLAHILARYVPHFVALSASSPFQQGEDTSYHSSRLNTVSAFPLSGQLPFVHTWGEFIGYFERMRGFGIVESMKDFYWDIRPKPEYGTVEIRVLDTPLTVERAALLAVYAQALARRILTERSLEPSVDVYSLYNYNRFQACRYGLQGRLVDPYRGVHVTIRDDIIDTLAAIRLHAAEMRGGTALERLSAEVSADRTDAGWLREAYASCGSLNDVARMQSERWMKDLAAA